MSRAVCEAFWEGSGLHLEGRNALEGWQEKDRDGIRPMPHRGDPSGSMRKVRSGSRARGWMRSGMEVVGKNDYSKNNKSHSPIQSSPAFLLE